MGTQIERFRLDRVLGTGSFGITYEAWDAQLERRVALKEYFPSETARREADSMTVYPSESDESGLFGYGLSRFLDEARTLARFRHPTIVGVQQYLEANGTAMLVMDFEEGLPLSTRITRRGVLEEQELRDLAVQLLEGLRAVHAEGVLHRDIKPANVLIREDGSPVLLDFGAARQLAPDKNMTIVLTPKYAPIEQYASDQAQGPWTDIYALGATLFHALTGRAPMLATERLIAKPGGDTVQHLLDTVSDRISPELRSTLEAMLQPDPEARLRSADEVLDRLSGAVTPPAPRFSGDDAPTVALGAGQLGTEATLGTGALTAAQLAASQQTEGGTLIAGAPGTVAPPTAGPTLGTAAGVQTGTAAGTCAQTGNGAFPGNDPTLAPARRGTPIAAIAFGAIALVAVAGGAFWALAPGDTSTTAATPAAATSAPAAIEPAASAAPEIVQFADPLSDRSGTGPDMVVVPAGDFLRGSPEIEFGRDDDEGPRTRIRMSAAFAIGRTEVTVAQFMAFVSATGYLTEAELNPGDGCFTWDGGWDARPGVDWRDPGYPQSNEHPSVCLSWNDAVAYTEWLSQSTGYRYGLPSEAQWEYATRAGSDAPHFWGDARACGYANVSDTSSLMFWTLKLSVSERPSPGE